MRTCLTLFLVFQVLILSSQGNRDKVNVALAQARSVSDTVRFNAYIDLATLYNFLPNTSDSVNYYASKALFLGSRSKNETWVMVAQYYKALYHQRYSLELDSALHYFQKMIPKLQGSESRGRLSSVYLAIGSVWYGKGDYVKAVEYYAKVFQLAESVQDYTSMVNVTSNMASINIEMGNNKEGLEMYEEALEYNKKDTTRDQINGFLNAKLNILELYVNEGRVAEAAKIIEEVRGPLETADFQLYKDRFSTNLFKYYEEVGDDVELKKLAASEFARIKDSDGTNEFIYARVAYYYAKKLLDEGRRSEARSVTDLLMARTGKTNANFEVKKQHMMYELNKELGRKEMSLSYLENYADLRDSLIGEENSATIQDLLAKYEVEKKERALQEAENEKLELKRNVFSLLAALLGLILLVLLYYLWSYKRRQSEKERIYNLEQKMLSLQMNPHFIFNAISSIQNYLFDEGDTKKALMHLSTFSNLMRQILENSRERFIPLEDEIEFLNNYLKLQKLRYDERFDYEIEVDSEIDVMSVSIPPLLTQPFVENAIEHGDLHLVPKGKISIKMSIEGPNLIVNISDNGVGMDAKVSHKTSRSGGHKSLAIKITKERLDLLNKLMNKNFTLDITSKKNLGTSVQLRIPTIYL